ncbi:uncharacterized protein LOC130751232 isoform X2 [Actinidia eriantha]|uniref:uncharacterized protein LOC130751232 isoform X2 n=1 Tax=Actinidia eriantha TaxID=165200 RepID=UPI00258AED22|nr:uncharacterized protein LOC130751232 isoform X2 [Actinidia eriantha]
MERLPYDPNLRLNELQPFRKFFEIESAYMASQGYYQNERFAALRQFALSYIEEISKCNPFDAFVPFLAMSYFDRFVSSRNLPKVITSNDEENLKLFVLCCLTLAWKMRIKAFKVEMFLEERKLKFDSKQVTKMELYILNALEWRMRWLTAIGFSGYFVPLLGIPSMMQPVQPVYQIIIRAQADINFTRFRPSTIAAAAILTAALKLFPEQYENLKVKISCCQFLREEELFPCMEAMKTTKFKAEEAWSAPIGEGTTDSEVDKPEHVGTSSSSQPPAKPRSDPIPILGSQAAKPHQLVQASSALFRTAIPPGLVGDEVEDLRRSEKAPLEVENEEIFEIEDILQPKIDDPYMDLELCRAYPQEPKLFPCMGAMKTTKFKAEEAWSEPIREGTIDSEVDKPEHVGTSRPLQPPTKPRSEPIPIPGSRAAKPTQLISASSALLRAAIPPGFADEVERLRRSEKTPLEVEMDEILQPKINDPYMNFELRWTNPQEPKVTAASVLWALVYDSGPISPIAPGGFSLSNCCPIMEWWRGGAHDQ